MRADWKEYALEDVVLRFIDYRGKTPRKTDSGIPLITAKVVKGGTIMPPNEFIASEDYDAWMRRGLPEVNDVVLTTEAPLGEVALLKRKDVALAQRIITIRGKPNVADNAFIKYYFQSSAGQHELHSRASGTTVFGIKASVLRKVPILLPPLWEQKAIAEILSSLDDKIDVLYLQNKTLETLVETLFRQWFIEGADHRWSEKALGDIIDVSRGLSYNGAGLTSEGLGLPFHNLKSVSEGGGYQLRGLKYYDGVYRDRHLINPGDIIIANTDLTQNLRVLGSPAMIPSWLPSRGIYSHHLYKVEILSETDFSKLFVYFLLKSAAIRDHLASAANGTTVLMLPADGVKDAVFQVPPKNLIVEFSVFASSVVEKQAHNEQQIRTLTKLRDTLLPKLMSGEVRVKL